MNHVTGNKERKKRKFSRKNFSKFTDGNSIRNYYEEFFFLVLYRVLYVFYLLLLQKTKWYDACIQYSINEQLHLAFSLRALIIPRKY